MNIFSAWLRAHTNDPDTNANLGDFLIANIIPDTYKFKLLLEANAFLIMLRRKTIFKSDKIRKKIISVRNVNKNNSKVKAWSFKNTASLIHQIDLIEVMRFIPL